MAKGNFWLGAAVGFVIMIFIRDALPVLGPIIGGFVAGLIARDGFMNGAKAGFCSGIFGALIIFILTSIIGLLGFGLFGMVAGMGIGILFIALALYYAVLGAAGGAIGGMIAK